MRLAIMAVLLCASLASAQGTPSATLAKGAWEFGVWSGGGVGVPGGVEETHTFSLGLRVGRVLTGEHGGSFLRGNLEWAADLIPAKLVFQPRPDGRETVYGAGFNPLILKWNFTGHRRVAPYFEMGGGMLFSARHVPFGTSKVNFTPQAGFGLQFFTARRNAVSVAAKYVHISNAGLEEPNPGVNTLQFTVGYSWFR